MREDKSAVDMYTNKANAGGGGGGGYSNKFRSYSPSKALLATICVTIFMLATLAVVTYIPPSP
jgi:hypothetical protein